MSFLRIFWLFEDPEFSEPCMIEIDTCVLQPTHVIGPCMKTLNEISKIFDQSLSRIFEIFEPKYPFNWKKLKFILCAASRKYYLGPLCPINVPRRKLWNSLCFVQWESRIWNPTFFIGSKINQFRKLKLI